MLLGLSAPIFWLPFDSHCLGSGFSCNHAVRPVSGCESAVDNCLWRDARQCYSAKPYARGCASARSNSRNKGARASRGRRAAALLVLKLLYRGACTRWVVSLCHQSFSKLRLLHHAIPAGRVDVASMSVKPSKVAVSVCYNGWLCAVPPSCRPRVLKQGIPYRRVNDYLNTGTTSGLEGKEKENLHLSAFVIENPSTIPGCTQLQAATSLESRVPFI